LQDEQIGAITAEKASLDETLQERDARIERLLGSLTVVKAELDGTMLGKNEIENKLRASEREVDDLQNQLGAWQSQIQDVLPAEAQPEEAQPEEVQPAEAAPAERGISETPTASRAAKATAFGAGLAALVSSNKDKDAQLKDAADRVAALEASLQEKDQALTAANAENVSLEDQVNGLAAEKASLEASVQQKEAELADLRSQLEASQAQVVDLRTHIAATAPFEEAGALAATLAKLPQSKQGAATAAIVAGVQPQFTPRLQNLDDVKGIGPVSQQRLFDAGIGSFWELASLSDTEMQAILPFTEAQLKRVSLDEIRASAYSLASKTDSVGQIWEGHHVDDFEKLSGIGSVYEARLYQAGISTYQQLAGTTVEQLAEICHAPSMNPPDYAEWIAQAKKMLEEPQSAPSTEPADTGEAAAPAETGEAPAATADAGEAPAPAAPEA